MDTLKIHLFGQLRVYQGEQGVMKFPTSKTQDLLCYLLLRRHRPHSRSLLASLFWPDNTEEQARKCLRTTLWRLRYALESDRELPHTYMIADKDEICFDTHSDYWLDIEEFEQCLAPSPALGLPASSESRRESDHQRRLTRAIELYQGDLLEGCYEDWCLYERERLQGLYLSALIHLMGCHRSQGAYEAAIRCGQRILNHDPLLEEVHRELMRLYCLSGNRGAALRQYTTCQAMLMQELRVEPMEETTALFYNIRHHPDTTAAQAPNTLPLQGEHSRGSQTITANDNLPLASQVVTTLGELRSFQAEFRHLSGRLQKGVDALEMIQKELHRRISPHL
jgi:DNA-binding SARP family transcriptional activator